MTTLKELQEQRAELDARIDEAEKQAQREANGGFAVGDKVVVEGTIDKIRDSYGQIRVYVEGNGYFWPDSSQIRHATPEPVAQKPVGYVNRYPDGEWSRVLPTVKEAERVGRLVSDATRIAAPVYLAPQPPPDTVSREDYQAQADLLNAEKSRYAKLEARYDALREKHDALRRERWEQKKQVDQKPKQDENPHDKARRLATELGELCFGSNQFSVVSYSGHINLANGREIEYWLWDKAKERNGGLVPTAVAPKGVVKELHMFLLALINDLDEAAKKSCDCVRGEIKQIRKTVDEDGASIRSRIVELPEAGADIKEMILKVDTDRFEISQETHDSMSPFTGGELLEIAAALLAAKDELSGTSGQFLESEGE